MKTMTKWCIDYHTMDKYIQMLKEKEILWKEMRPQKYMNISSFEYFIRQIFEKEGFWVEEDSNNG